MTRRYLRWEPILDHAAAIVRGYDTGVTLRQLFYRLVADGTLPNLGTYYKRLSHNSAQARRDGWFPDLLDRTSRIEERTSFSCPDQARDWLRSLYRRDRTAGQGWTIFLGVEKAGISEQLDAWLAEPLGVPHVALGGYASQTLCDQVARYVAARGRPAVLIYAGDHDPSGEDIDRDFAARVGTFEKVIRVALSADQAVALPENVLDPEVVHKLEDDPRAARFLERHGELRQVELDAVPPEQLRSLYRSAVEGFWDDDAYQIVLAQETEHRTRL